MYYGGPRSHENSNTRMSLPMNRHGEQEHVAVGCSKRTANLQVAVEAVHAYFAKCSGTKFRGNGDVKNLLPQKKRAMKNHHKKKYKNI